MVEAGSTRRTSLESKIEPREGKVIRVEGKSKRTFGSQCQEAKRAGSGKPECNASSGKKGV